MAIIFTERAEQIDRAGYEAWQEYQRTHKGDTPDHSESFQMGAEWADCHQWQSMDNNTPQNNECVLISTHDGLQVAEYDGEYGIFTDAHGLGEIIKCAEVLAWMRVPALEQNK